MTQAVSHNPTRNLFQRLHSVMQEVDYIQKERKQGMKYTIVSHDAVTGKVRPLLVKHGIVYTSSVKSAEQDGTMTKTLVDVTFINIDSPEDRHTVTMLGHGIDSQDKGPGKAISYAVKYALLKTLGLETGDDPDQEQDVRRESKHPATVRLATEEQLFELDELLSTREVASDFLSKCLQKAGVSSPNEMPADKMQKTIDHMRKLPQLAGAV